MTSSLDFIYRVNFIYSLMQGFPNVYLCIFYCIFNNNNNVELVESPTNELVLTRMSIFICLHERNDIINRSSLRTFYTVFHSRHSFHICHIGFRRHTPTDGDIVLCFFSLVKTPPAEITHLSSLREFT